MLKSNKNCIHINWIHCCLGTEKRKPDCLMIGQEQFKTSIRAKYEEAAVPNSSSDFYADWLLLSSDTIQDRQRGERLCKTDQYCQSWLSYINVNATIEIKHNIKHTFKKKEPHTGIYT